MAAVEEQKFADVEAMRKDLSSKVIELAGKNKDSEEHAAKLELELETVKSNYEAAKASAAKASDEHDRLKKGYDKLMKLHGSEMATADQQKEAAIEALRQDLSSKIMELTGK